MSDDHDHALTIIGFVGSVFSPYYAFARARGWLDPDNYCAINVALYGKRYKRWALTERTRRALVRSRNLLRVGSSEIRWTGSAFELDIDEWTAPLPSPIRGRIRITPSLPAGHPLAIDRDGKHKWFPIAPLAIVEADFVSPRLNWIGSGYVDGNVGEEPIELAFRRWNWSRAHINDSTVVFYDIQRRDGTNQALSILFDETGARTITAPPISQLPKTRWRVERATRSEGTAEIVTTFEDTPFYARSMISSNVCGSRAYAMHESLDLNRLTNPAVRFMLPFRMPRRFI